MAKKRRKKVGRAPAKKEQSAAAFGESIALSMIIFGEVAAKIRLRHKNKQDYEWELLRMADNFWILGGGLKGAKAREKAERARVKKAREAFEASDKASK